MRSFLQQEDEILTHYDVVSEIVVFEHDNIRQAHISPNLPLLAARGILNIHEYIRLDVLDLYNQHLSPEEKIIGFKLFKDPLSQQALEDGDKERMRQSGMTESREYHLLSSFLQYFGRQQISPEDHLDIDLALTSLEKVQLFVFLGSMFGLELNEQDLMTHFSVESLAHYVAHQSKRVPDQLPQQVALDSVRWGKILRDHGSFKLPESRLTHDIVLKLTGTFAGCYFRLKGAGLEHIPESPVIIAANHQCFFDGFIMGHFLPRRFMKNSYVFAVEKHFNTPFRRFVAETANVIVVNINRDLKTPLQKMAAVLQKGSNVFIFPEGTRTKDGRLGAFKETFAILSREFDVPVVPAVIQGGFEAMPIGSVFPKPFKKISLTFLPPIYPEEHSYQEISELLRCRIQEALDAPRHSGAAP